MTGFEEGSIDPTRPPPPPSSMPGVPSRTVRSAALPPGSRRMRVRRPDPTGRFSDGSYQAMVDLKSPGLLKMLVVGTLLQFLTIGIYRFWFLVTLRRQLWQRSSLAGSPFEYTGTTGEIFRGFLVALILLVPIWTCYGAGSWLVQTGEYREIAGAMLAVSVLAFLFFAYFASYRARRYRVSRTLWRGLRFRQTGSGLLYAVMNFGWWLLLLPTLGLSVPFARAQLERYRVRHMWFGNRRFETRTTGRMMLGPYLLYYAVIFGPPVIGIAIAIAVLPSDFAETILTNLKAARVATVTTKQFVAPSALSAITIGLGVLELVWLIVMPLLLWPVYRACELRRFIGRISLGQTRFRSNFSALEIYVCNIIFCLICSGLFSGLSLLAVIAVGIGLAVGIKIDNQFIALGLAATGYLVGFFLLSVLKLRIYLFELTGRLIASITVDGVEQLQDVISQSDRAGAIGDDFAGGFDIGAI